MIFIIYGSILKELSDKSKQLLFNQIKLLKKCLTICLEKPSIGKESEQR